MPRRPRMYLPGFTYHVVQRGNNRNSCFFEEENYQVYLHLMTEVLPRYDVLLHAYCLMTNHVHLLLTTGLCTGISNVMRVVCSRYAQYVNKKYGRTGTMWEGRHKASAIDTDRYLLKCYRYIEMNPVAAGIVTNPGDYRWTSYHANASAVADGLVSSHPVYAALGETREKRCGAYRTLFGERLSPVDIHAIRKAAHYSMPLGSDAFLGQVERRTGRKLGFMARGRPSGQRPKTG